MDSMSSWTLAGTIRQVFVAKDLGLEDRHLLVYSSAGLPRALGGSKSWIQPKRALIWYIISGIIYDI